MTDESLQRLRYWLEKNYQQVFDWFPSSLDSDTVQYHLFAALRKCPAQTEATFLAWVKQCCKDIANDYRINMFLWFQTALRETGRPPSVARIKARLSLEPRRDGLPPFPESEINNGVATIPLVGKKKTVLWKVPSDGSNDPAKNFLPVCQLLWPCRSSRNRIYQCRVTQDAVTQSWSIKTPQSWELKLHHVFGWFKWRDAKPTQIESHIKNNFTDFTELFVESADVNALAEAAMKTSAWKTVHVYDDDSRESEYRRVPVNIPRPELLDWEIKLNAQSRTQATQQTFERSQAQYPVTKDGKPIEPDTWGGLGPV